MKTLLEWLKMLGVLLAAILLGELPAVKSVSLLVNQNRSWLLPIMLGLTAAGFLILLWAWTMIGIRLGKPMTHGEVEQLAARTQILGPGKRFSKARLWGKTSGVKVDPPLGWTFREMKDAWRNGAWWSDAEMRRKYIITGGGILCILGGFAAMLVATDPASVKLILGGAILYAAARLIWGFRRA